MQHNEIRDITAQFLTETCRDVMTEPPLQELSGETISYQSANTEDNACVDIVVHGFWSPFQWTFLDVRVLTPFAFTYTNVPVCYAHRQNEVEKRCCYEEQVETTLLVLHSLFTYYTQLERGVLFAPLNQMLLIALFDSNRISYIYS